MLEMNSVIDIDIHTEKGAIWKVLGLGFHEYLSTLFVNAKTVLNVRYHNHLFRMYAYKHKYRDEITLRYSDCILYNLKTNDVSELSDFSTDCNDIISGKIKVEKKTEYMLDFIDGISRGFGVSKVYLVDAATSKLNRDIDLSLYMVMKCGKTFYERYGYTFCDEKLNFDVQKSLLRNFRFDIFYTLLRDEQLTYVSKLLGKLRKTDYVTLGEFYVDVYDLYHKKGSDSIIVKLQQILYDPTQPWYSMIDILTKKKECMYKSV
jgi:hypothetical protein